MAFQPTGLSKEDLNLHLDHSRLITGTVAAALAGHGYREEGDTSHMDAILRIYVRLKGEGVRRTPSNKAMQAGIDLEPVAFEHLKKKLAKSAIPGFEGVMTADAAAGMRLDDTDGESFGYGANIDAPLFLAEGEMSDPTTGKPTTAKAYISKWSRLEKDRLDIIKSNELRRAMGEPEVNVPENPLPVPPLAGVGDIKATMSWDVRMEVESLGPYAGWIAQLHWYNTALRAFNEKNGYPEEDYPSQMMIAHLYSADMETRFYPVPYDPGLEAELLKRAAKLNECLDRNISPASPEMSSYFTPYPVKRLPASSRLASTEVEERLELGFQQLDLCDQKVQQWTDKKIETEERIQRIYELDAETSHQTVYALGREMQNRVSVRTSKSINRDAVDGVINAAAAAKSHIESALAALQSGDVESGIEALQKIQLNSLPAHNVRSLDAYEVTTLKESTKFTIKNTKKAQKTYDLLLKKERPIKEDAPVVSRQKTPAGSASQQSDHAGVKKKNVEQADSEAKQEEPSNHKGPDKAHNTENGQFVPPALREHPNTPSQPPLSQSPEKTFTLTENDKVKLRPADSRTPNPFTL